MKVYCNYCKEITSHRQKGLRAPENVCDVCDSTNMPVALIRENDGLINRGTDVKFIEWEDGRGKSLKHEPEVGLSVVLDLRSAFMWGWMTTEIVEITEDSINEDCRTVKFKTKNSDYVLNIFQSSNKE